MMASMKSAGAEVALAIVTCLLAFLEAGLSPISAQLEIVMPTPGNTSVTPVNLALFATAKG